MAEGIAGASDIVILTSVVMVGLGTVVGSLPGEGVGSDRGSEATATECRHGMGIADRAVVDEGIHCAPGEAVSAEDFTPI